MKSRGHRHHRNKGGTKACQATINHWIWLEIRHPTVELKSRRAPRSSAPSSAGSPVSTEEPSASRSKEEDPTRSRPANSNGPSQQSSRGSSVEIQADGTRNTANSQRGPTCPSTTSSSSTSSSSRSRSCQRGRSIARAQVNRDTTASSTGNAGCAERHGWSAGRLVAEPKRQKAHEIDEVGLSSAKAARSVRAPAAPNKQSQKWSWSGGFLIVANSVCQCDMCQTEGSGSRTKSPLASPSRAITNAVRAEMVATFWPCPNSLLRIAWLRIRLVAAGWGKVISCEFLRKRLRMNSPRQKQQETPAHWTVNALEMQIKPNKKTSSTSFRVMIYIPLPFCRKRGFGQKM